MTKINPMRVPDSGECPTGCGKVKETIEITAVRATEIDWSWVVGAARLQHTMNKGALDGPCGLTFEELENLGLGTWEIEGCLKKPEFYRG